MRSALMKDARFRRAIEERDGSRVLSARRQLLLSALRLSPNLAPHLFDALGQVVATLGIDAPIEVYCVSDRDINAFVVPPDEGVVLLGITSEGLERLDEGELRFVLGHELGHALYEHFRLSPEALLEDETLAPIHLARLCAWMRYAELTADRVGLLCCDDFDTAVRAFFKLTSGLSSQSFLRHAEECATQFATVAADGMESSEQDWFSTHPYSPLRIKALDAFSRSETFHALLGRRATDAAFHRLLGKSGKPISEAELEREVHGIMSLMDPSFLDDASPVAPLVQEYLALAGMDVALADGTIARGEKKALGRLVGKRGVTQAKERLLSMSAEEHAARLGELARELSLKLGDNRKKKIVEDLVVIALADNELQRAEVDVLIDAARRLGVPPQFVEVTLSRALAGLD